MKSQNAGRLTLFLLFLIGLWALSAYLGTTLPWLVLINLLSLYILWGYGTLPKRELLLGAVLGALCLPSSPAMGVSVVLPTAAALMIFSHSKNRLYFYDTGKKHCLPRTLVLIFVVGGVLGAINVFLAMGQMPLRPSFSIQWVFDALRAGIFEEVFFRFILFALCIYLTGDRPLSRLDNWLCYGVIVIPHVLIHFTLGNFNIGNFVVLTLLFGLPFAWMQRRTNLLSAMGSHAFVDFIRFCMLGA